jgi:hypothetical protein
MHRILLFILLFSLSKVSAQNPSAFYSLVEKGKWTQAWEKTEKALLKDSLNPFYTYFHTWLWIHDSTRLQAITESYRAINSTIYQYDSLTDVKQQEKWLKRSFGSVQLQALKVTIEQLAYDSTRLQDTEAAYNRFLSTYLNAANTPAAVARRNELAYAEALKINTPAAFEAFYRKYPDAEQVKDAKEFYEARLFEEKTKGKTLAEYETFVAEYPQSPYRADAEKAIFPLKTIQGLAENFLQYAEKYPEASYARKAIFWAFHLSKADEKAAIITRYSGSQHMADSLHALLVLNNKTLFPIYENGVFDLMDASGEKMGFKLHGLSASLRCATFLDELITDSLPTHYQLINRKGTLIFQSKYLPQWLGKGFYMVNSMQGQQLFHVAEGDKAIAIADSIALINHQLIALQNQGRWSLQSLSGIKIGDYYAEQIVLKGDLIAIKRGRWAIGTAHDFIRQDGQWDFVIDSITQKGRHFLLHQAGKTGLYTAQLQRIIPYHPQQITLREDWWEVVREAKYLLFDQEGGLLYEMEFDSVLYQGALVAALLEGKWRIIHRSTNEMQQTAYDSIDIAGNSWLMARSGDSLFFLTPSGERIFQAASSGYQLLRSPQQGSPGSIFAEYLIQREKDGSIKLYNPLGQLILQDKNISISPINHEHLSITKNNKRGILSAQGEWRINPSKDAIANPGDRMVATLEKQKFGAYDFVSQQHIPNQYNQIIQRYVANDSLFIARKDEKRGLINALNQEVFPFNFEEISAINDTLAFIKKETDWDIFHLYTHQRLNDYPIRQFYRIADSPFYMAFSDKGYGIMRFNGRWIVPPAFSEIINIGSTEAPIFFCERYIPEAMYHVVVYYDADGDIIYRNAYTSEEFDLLNCEDWD